MTPISENKTMPAETLQFRKVAECLYRHESSKVYYALVKRAGKQIRRSLKTKDRKLADRRLADFRQKVGQLSLTASASQITFTDLAARWLASLRPTLKASSYARRQTSIAQITPYLGTLSLRQIASRSCEDWAGKRSPEVSASTYNNERDSTNLVELLAYSGMRLSEAVSLRWREVQFSSQANRQAQTATDCRLGSVSRSTQDHVIILRGGKLQTGADVVGFEERIILQDLFPGRAVRQ